MKRGFSLLEVVVSGSAFAIMCLAILGVYRIGLNTESVTAQRTMLQDGLQIGMKAFDRDIGEASASLAVSGSQSIALLVPVFDATGAPTGFSDAVTFAVAGTTLYQTVVPGAGSTRKALAGKRLLGNIPAPYPSPGLFSFWTRAGGDLQPATPADATVVRVYLAQSAKYGGRTQTVTLSRDIRMRNR